jgi:hypothetical protein
VEEEEEEKEGNKRKKKCVISKKTIVHCVLFSLTAVWINGKYVTWQ